jgi:hypothetical protein
MKLTNKYIGVFITYDPTSGISTDADSNPSAVVYRNGDLADINPSITDYLTVSGPVANPSSDRGGIYKVEAFDTWSKMGFSNDDKIDIIVTSTVDSITASAVIDSFVLDDGDVKLASDGLDNISITEPSGVATTFREMVVQTWRRFFKKATLTSSQLKTYDDDGDVKTTQSVTNDDTTETIDDAS